MSNESSTLTESQSPERPNYPPYLYIDQASLQKEPFDLIDLMVQLWKRKWIILIITLLFSSVSIAIALWLPNIYISTSYMKEVNTSRLDSLNISRSAFNLGLDDPLIIFNKAIGPDKAYNLFVQQLSSKSTRSEFFSQNVESSYSKLYSGSSREKLFLKFEENLSITESTTNSPFLQVSFKHPDSVEGSQWVNLFVDFAHGRAKEALLSSVNKKLENEVERNELRLNNGLKNARKQLNAEIVTYQNAIKVAKSLELENGLSDVTVELDGSKLYMLGYAPLEAELMILNDIKDNGLLDYYKELQLFTGNIDFLENKKIDQSNLDMIRIDTQAYPSDIHIQPKRSIIVVLMTIFGFLIGILAALLKIAIRKNK